MMHYFRDDFTRRILDLHGEVGQAWLKNLPTTIASVESIWRIRVDKPFHALTYNYVAPAVLEDGSEAILKLGVPGDHVLHEAKCLQRYDGLGAPFLLEFDPDQGALLIERIRPGSDLKGLAEDEAIDAIAAVMRQLHHVHLSDAELPTVADWWKGFQRLRAQFRGATGPFPARLVDEAEAVYTELEGSMAASVLLHGDLHHENVLAGERLPWIAIDPQGVIGEPAYEVGAFLRNPPELVSKSGLDRILKRRVDRFSEILSIDRKRIAGWGFSQAVLSGIWSFEDHGSGWEGALKVASILHKLVRPFGK
jgi:streptomycin 6-kinase